MTCDLLKHLNELRVASRLNHAVIADFITDNDAAEKLASDWPFAFARYWPSATTSNGYYAVSVYNPTDVTHPLVHLSVVFTPGWASNYSREDVNTALAAREFGWPTYTGKEVSLPPKQSTTIQLDFPVPQAAPSGYKYLGIGLLWGTHPSPERVYYDITRFYTMKH